MTHFAEIDSNNKVLRVVAACDTDVAAYGGDQSEKAAENFRRTVPLSVNGVKWVQTSSTFRGHRCNVGETFDAALNIFKGKKQKSSSSVAISHVFHAHELERCLEDNILSKLGRNAVTYFA